MSMTVGVAEQFFKSKAFKEWQKGQESEVKVLVAVVNRLNDVIRSIGALGKALSSR